MKFNLADELFIEKRPAGSITIADFYTYSGGGGGGGAGTTRAAEFLLYFLAKKKVFNPATVSLSLSPWNILLLINV
jgi:hypothetical protein